jgi:hypothetical protein
MSSGAKAIMLAVLSIATVFTTSGANAVPAVSPPVVVAGESMLQIVQYRRYGGYNTYRGGNRYGYRRNYGRNIGIGIGAAVIGGILLSEAARAEHRTTHSGDWDRCAQTYRSFEPSTGMYTGYDGERHTCPYLN